MKLGQHLVGTGLGFAKRRKWLMRFQAGFILAQALCAALKLERTKASPCPQKAYWWPSLYGKARLN
jgi:hypothetical protein